ncbi:Fe-S cluster assembly protein SufD [Paracoccus sp. S-4012]|uniref:SufB/SufD family protein n=1 Tax=Paracoccus sp. S-4012 TaxID=2665648 RepID=UPI0012B153A0|nr:SufD family Fe-S cluster assembly protein [Paracoccus sp. S-4012]MRX49572.1 Fe-S cluster assembly protein SufD [Paracoccus sp. S-4012]
MADQALLSNDAVLVGAADPLPQDALTPAREAARERVETLGLPGRRDEYWRFTRPDAFLAPDAPAVPLPEGDGILFAEVDRLKLVFVDGRFDASASDALELDGVEIAPLSEAPWAASLYGSLEGRAHIPVPRPFAALNTAAAVEGLAIHVTGKVSRPIHILHRSSDGTADALWHHVIRVEPGAEATILETGIAGARQNAVIEADIAEGGRLHMIAAKRAGVPELSLGHLFARVAEGGTLKSFELALDGRVMRRETVVEMAGDDAVVHVAGASYGRDKGFHHDDTIFISHAGLRGESRQVFKKVLQGGATGVFQGKILVKPGAQKTDGYQISQALLLDDGSQFLAKPELEIHADDVKCSHGSTTGALDETALFYLRSRGVPRPRAVVLMVLSFLAAALEEIEDEALRTQVADRLDEALTEGLNDGGAA